jgi:hypothetical protein
MPAFNMSEARLKTIKKLQAEIEAKEKKIKKLVEYTNSLTVQANADNESLQEKNKKLEQENSMLRDLLQDRMPVGCIAETTYQPVLAENEKLKEENDKLKWDCEQMGKSPWVGTPACDKMLKLIEENKKLKEELLYYRFSTYTLDRGGDCDLTKEDVDNFTDEEALRKTLYERIGYEEDQ